MLFIDDSSSVKLASLDSLIDRKAQRVQGSTGELSLDYQNGLLTINAHSAQGICGTIRTAKKVKLKSVEIESDREFGCIVAVALDGLPLGHLRRLLLK